MKVAPKPAATDPVPGRLAIAAVQITSTEDVEQNLARSAAWTRRAAEAGAQLVVLPENYGFLGPEEARLAHAQSVEEGGFVAPLREVAREHAIHVLAGSIPEAGPDATHTYNTSVLIGPRGETLAVYRKIHLFDVDVPHGPSFRESASVAPGREPVVADVRGWPIGLTICYDLRFPELYRALASQGALLLAVPAAFTLQTGKDHWDLLLRARAVENTCFVVASGQFGHHGGPRYSWGKSQVIDAWGTPLAIAPEREGFALAVIDPDDQERVRRMLPSLRHRRM
jgi:predicted amidohydrolase